MIQPSLLVNCSSTVLCLQMFYPKSINHRYLRGLLHFKHTDLCLLCSFLVYVNHPKPKPESGSASALAAGGKKHLSPSQLRKTKETQLFLPSWCYVLSWKILFHDRQWLELTKFLQSANTTKLKIWMFRRRSGLPPPNSKCIRWYGEPLALYNTKTRITSHFRVLAARTQAKTK